MKHERVNQLLLASASIVAIGLSSSVFAAGGNESYLTQTGNSQTATITQSGGSNNKVGTSGSPFIQQNGAGSYGHNVLTIDQNTANAGSGNSAAGYQSGSSNNADIDQNGSYSSVYLTQSGRLNGSVSSATWFNNENEVSRVVQDATANGSGINIQQSNYIGADRGNIFNVGQGGSNNHVNATQTANSGQPNSARNDLWIRQGTQAPDLWSWTNGNPFWTAGYGLSGSTITITQDAGQYSGVNYAALGQGGGSGDIMNITQVGASNSVDANQLGTGNTFSSQQYSGGTNTGWNFVGGEDGWPETSKPIYQNGNYNMYTSFQSGSELWAFGSQIGNGNSLNNVQTGSVNKLFSSQNGDSNAISSTQAGDTNTTTVAQSANSNISSSYQNGSNNMATITQ